MSNHYDTIGKTYTSTRAADPRILQQIVDLLALPTNAKLLDIGAGTGNYSHALAELGFSVDAVEPSIVMRDQARAHSNLKWHATSAESMDFADGSFDGVVMTLCLHHLADWQLGVKEALRISGGGPIVIFGFDIEHKASFWLFDYFPQFREIDKGWAPTMHELELFVQQSLQANIERFPFPLPKDLVDHFASADWAYPETYLDEKFRKGISSFAKLSPENLERGLKNLKTDLANGNWNEKYGSILQKDTYDRGYLFIRISS
jgi:SAM-dependent methyltransferase